MLEVQYKRSVPDIAWHDSTRTKCQYWALHSTAAGLYYSYKCQYQILHSTMAPSMSVRDRPYALSEPDMV
eukprot:1415950-Rhodomonas_salina.1